MTLVNLSYGDICASDWGDLLDPVEDVYWTERDYRETFPAAGLELVHAHQPLGTGADPFPWVTEQRVSPWMIHVLRRAGHAR